MTHDGNDVIVVGGGLGGLTAATYLARAGRRVLLLEGSGHLGGRAISQDRDGYVFNLGSHALYRAGRGIEVLREFGVAYSGGTPPTTGLGVIGGRAQPLPSRAGTLLRSQLLSAREKMELGLLMVRLPRMDLSGLEWVTVHDWLQRSIRGPVVRSLVEALVRLTTYTNDPHYLSAGSALAQVRRGLKGVYYLDGGWQTLVDGLQHAAIQAGVTVRTGARVAAVRPNDGAVRVLADGGATYEAGAVVLAVPPAAACALLGDAGTELARWSTRVRPARAACLDVAIRRLPRPSATFALGIDRPLYLSVISAHARVAPPGGAVIQTIRYLQPDEVAEPDVARGELEGLLDLIQPGWREATVAQRFLPNLVAASAVPGADGGGQTGRPGPMAPGVPRVFLAGDWVGSEGLLADATLTSARRAAHAILEMPPAEAKEGTGRRSGRSPAPMVAR
jgi:phytoene dehydrogenase-like protein